MTRGRWYEVVSPEYGEVIPILDDGTGPMEYGADFLYVRARNAHRAKTLAVRAWRRAHAKYLEPGENPFTGVKATRVNYSTEDTPNV